MTQKIQIKTKNAPEAIGPYSQAIESNGFIFISGQIPINPSSGAVEATTVQAQTEQVLKNLEGILKERNLTFANVLKTTVFIKNMGDFGVFNEIYGKYFQAPYPARATVEVSRLPKDVLIEIEAIAKT